MCGQYFKYETTHSALSACARLHFLQLQQHLHYRIHLIGVTWMASVTYQQYVINTTVVAAMHLPQLPYMNLVCEL